MIGNNNSVQTGLIHEERRFPMQQEEARTFARITRALDSLLVESNSSIDPHPSPDLGGRIFRALSGYLTVRVW